MFLAFQYPVEIPGVSTSYFLKAAVNAVRKHRGEPELDAMDFLKLVEGEDEAAEDGPELHEAADQRRILRRREEAQRNLPDGRRAIRSWR